MGTLSKIRELCEVRKVAISRLEKDCGFSNASIKALRTEDVPFDRVVKIAKYFGVPLEYFSSERSDAGMILSQEEKDLIFAYRNKSDDAKDVIAASLGVKRQDTGLRSSNKAEGTA